MYRYEMHLHTWPLSSCGGSTIIEMIDRAVELGYQGIVVTDHFIRGNTGVDRDIPWRDFVRTYEENYLKGKEYAKKYDFDVIFGIEEVYAPGREILIYGLTPKELADLEEFPRMNVYEIAELVRGCGGLIAAAHPYRARSYIPNPDKDPDPTCFDAIEVYNAHNKASENDKALAFCKKHGLIEISGGDHHRTDSLGGSGVLLKNRVRDGKELAAELKKREHIIITEDRGFTT